MINYPKEKEWYCSRNSDSYRSVFLQPVFGRNSQGNGGKVSLASETINVEEAVVADELETFGNGSIKFILYAIVGKIIVENSLKGIRGIMYRMRIRKYCQGG